MNRATGHTMGIITTINKVCLICHVGLSWHYLLNLQESPRLSLQDLQFMVIIAQDWVPLQKNGNIYNLLQNCGHNMS